MVGEAMLFAAMSLKRSVICVIHEEVETNALRRKNLKKHVTHTAHSVIVSLLLADEDSSSLTWRRISVALLEDLRMPRSTSESFGNSCTGSAPDPSSSSEGAGDARLGSGWMWR